MQIKSGKKHKTALSLILLLLFLGGFFLYGETVYGNSQQTVSGAQATAIANKLEDAAAKVAILDAISKGATVTYTYNDNGKIIAYRAVIPERKIPGEKKYWKNMTEGEKKAALILLKTPGNIPYVKQSVSVGGVSHGLNEDLWYSKGIIVYGSSFGGTSSAGPRYWGYDLNGGYYGNDNFPRDSDSGRQPWEKDWWTTAEIRDNTAAKNLVGGHALTDAFVYADKLRTAKAFLGENPAWKSHGLDENYILSHFFFNSVISDNGLSGGQFIGVQKNAGQLWYQTFSVEAPLQMFTIVPAETIQGEVIVWNDAKEEVVVEPEPEPEPVPVPLPEATIVEGIPILSLPLFTYEGHPAPARDQSIYTVGGETWSAYRTLKAGLTTNRFVILEKDVGTLTQQSILDAEAIFDEAGTYNVRLRIAPKGSEYLYDVKSIEVGKTPTILHSLTGTKKENRKQVINLSVVTHPKAPLTEFWVEIESLASGEKVRLLHDPKKPGVNALSNSETIKTRPIAALVSDEYFTNCKLEFLTKNPDWESFRYTVYVKDSRGRTEQVAADFDVAPDLPPKAAIDLEKAFIRTQGTNLAQVEAADVTTTDGDQVSRNWSLCLAAPGTLPEDWPLAERAFTPLKEAKGFQDISMEEGRLQQVAFSKEGVGAFALRLDVKDVWTEETLEEYISEEDYLTDFTTAESHVVNIAPIVSLKPITSQKAEILMLAESDEDYAALKEAAAALGPEFLGKGIDGRITVKQTAPASSDITTGANQIPTPVVTVKEPFGYEGSWTFLGGSSYMVDEHRMYTLQATWKGTGLNDYPQSPYVITAYSGAAGEAAWSFTLTDSIMTVNTKGSWHEDKSRFATDEEGEYLFFRNGSGKTLVLSAATGAYQTVLNFEVGNYNCSTKGAIYSFKEDGIYRISTRGQGVRLLYPGTISADNACKQAGKVHFLARQGGALYRGLLAPDGEKVTLERLTGEVATDYRTQFTLLGVDSEGTMMVHKYYNDGVSTAAAMEVFGRDNRLARKVEIPYNNSWNSSYYRAAAWKPVYDENGKCNYMAYTKDSSSSGSSTTTYYNYVEIYHTADGSGASDIVGTSVSSKSGHVTNNDIIYADQFGSKVYVCTGGIRTYVYGSGYGVYTEKANTFTFDTITKTAARTTSGLGFENDGEFGRTSANYAAIHTDDNSLSQINGSKTVLLTWAQNTDQVLSRYINKYSSGEGDRKYVIVYDSSGQTTGTNLRLTRQALQARKTQDVFLNHLGENLAGVLLGQEERNNVLAVKTEHPEEGGILSFDFALDPAKEYFYEYEWRQGKGTGNGSNGNSESGEAGALQGGIHSSVASLIGKVLNDNEFGNERYYVQEAIAEDFEDKNVNPFFLVDPARIRSGKYWATKSQSSSSSSNSLISDSDTIRFTIPEGKKAVLTFDYDMHVQGSTWTNNYININGKQWDLFQSNGSDVKGTYTAKEFLPEGVNELYFYSGYYGKKSQIGPYLIIDNLTVSYVDRTSGQEEEDGRAGHVASGGGWIKASGSFSTPAGAAVYQSISATYYKDTFAKALAAGHITRTGTRSPYTYTIKIPTGKTAAMLGVNTTSADRTTYTWENYGWERHTDYQSRISDIGSPFYLWLPKNLTGEQIITSNATGVTELTMLLTNKANRLINEERFFCGNDGLIYAENQRYSGKTEFTLGIPAGDHILYIKNLKIYTMIDGIKTYVCGEDFSDPAGLTAWKTQNVIASIVPEEPRDPEGEHGLVYRKGELIAYNIKYYDHESDPSKKSYWKYTHTPFNDGPHPDAAVILDEDGNIVSMNGTILGDPIQRFEIDGKYTVEHWQEDDTSRGAALTSGAAGASSAADTASGTAGAAGASSTADAAGYLSYDKHSNVETLTFYVEGASSAPRITSIKTQPSSVKEGAAYTILVSVDDDEKDVLRLDTELYLGGEVIQTDRQPGITAKNGAYPQLKIPASALAQVGGYEVVCTVRDETGVGLGSYRFTVVSEGKITGMVNHTDEWDINRKKYNVNRFGEEVNRTVTFAAYSKESAPRKRGTNVFWSGERFELSAPVGGSPLSVTCQILGQSYSTTLTATGKKDSAGDALYAGSLWHSDMVNKWGRKNPEELTFRFTATYAGGIIKTHDTAVILDSLEDYWLLHRLW